MSNFVETEYKYDASGVSLEDFQSLVMRLFAIKRTLVVSGYDDYFGDPDGTALRHRYNSDHAELTVKKRLSKDATAQRREVDIKILPGQAAEVSELARTLSCEKDYTIYKTCLIYWARDFNLVFYVVYNPAMHELNRFIEIEADKACKDPIAVIDYVEWVLSPHIPAVHKVNRLNLSMHERYTTTKRVRLA